MISASFFWRNDQPDGLGFTLNAASGWSSSDLDAAFNSDIVDDYFRSSDELVGDDIVKEYFCQLEMIAARKPHISTADAIIAALNIMWLCSRGHLVADEFNGPMFVQDL